MDTAWALVRDIVREDLNFRHAKFSPKFGGHTGASTGIMTSSDGRSVFVKWAGVEEPFGREALRFEVAAHQWMPVDVVGSAFMVTYREDIEGMAAAFGVNWNPSPQYWSKESLRATVSALLAAHASLRLADAPISLPDVESRLFRVLNNPDNPWFKEAVKFTNLAFTNNYSADICHSDIHKGNVMINTNSGLAEIVDWAWVTRMPASYDLAMLAIDAAVDGLNPWSVAKYSDVSKKEFRLALATYASTLYSLNPDEHKHARTRLKRQELIKNALNY